MGHGALELLRHTTTLQGAVCNSCGTGPSWTLSAVGAGVQGVMPQTQGLFRAQGSAPTLVSSTPPPLGPFRRGGARGAAATVVAAAGGGTVIATAAVARATCDPPYR